MILALALLIAQADLAGADRCTIVKRVVRTSVDAFRTAKGEKREESAKKVIWTAPVLLPGASECKVFEYKDGSQPFYGCVMQAASCKANEAKFVELAQEVSTCIGAPVKMEDDGKKRSARLHKGGVPVRITFERDKDCPFRFFVEPIQQDKH
jgi:hypothetical protein